MIPQEHINSDCGQINCCNESQRSEDVLIHEQLSDKYLFGETSFVKTDGILVFPAFLRWSIKNNLKTFINKGVLRTV